MHPDPGFRPLETDRLRLRRSTPEDAEAISAYRSIPDVGKYQGWDRTDAGFLREELALMATRSPGEPGWVQLSVELREDGRLVGDVGMSPADGEPGVLKVGYTVAPEHQGAGYATEAVRALIAYGFSTLGAEVVRVYADADNLASIRVAEKSGMTLMERFEHRHGDETWWGVRFEIRPGDPDASG